MNSAEMSTYNQMIRDKFATYSAPVQAQIIKALAACFDTSVRNSNLWVTSAATRRGFLNKSVGQLELNMRINFLTSFVGIIPIPHMSKEGCVYSQTPEANGLELRKYLQDEAFQARLIRIDFYFSSYFCWVISTESPLDDGSQPDEDLDSDEFADLVEE